MRRWLLLLIFPLVAACTPVQLGLDGNLYPSPTPVLGPPTLSAEQLAGWFEENSPGCYAVPDTSPLDLARAFIQAGFVEGVAGDRMFMQSVIESGWFSFSNRPGARPCTGPTGQVKPQDFNFGGLGAVDSEAGTGRHVAQFENAFEGARAQAQHLVAYTTTDRPCGPPCLDPRFGLVRRGVAQTWDQFGCVGRAPDGAWATSCRTGTDLPRDYGLRILNLYKDGLAYARDHP
jgi:hypothetical protein